jgi:hypothetical protein
MIIKYFLFPLIAAAISIYNGKYDVATIIIVIVYVSWMLFRMLHAIEYKLNKLLDERGIYVSQHQILDDL